MTLLLLYFIIRQGVRSVGVASQKIRDRGLCYSMTYYTTLYYIMRCRIVLHCTISSLACSSSVIVCFIVCDFIVYYIMLYYSITDRLVKGWHRAAKRRPHIALKAILCYASEVKVWAHSGFFQKWYSAPPCSNHVFCVYALSVFHETGCIRWSLLRQ